jgi:hypothetical protein
MSLSALYINKTVSNSHFCFSFSYLNLRIVDFVWPATVIIAVVTDCLINTYW